MRVALENSIMIQGGGCSAGSKIIQNFTAPFNASVYEKLTGSHVVTSAWQVEALTEFGTFPFFENLNTDGLTEAVVNGDFSAVLVNDYSGAAKFLAAKNNLMFLQPTYGAISRFGLTGAASSMDQIGILAKSINSIKEVFNAICGKDEKDAATYNANFAKAKTKLTVKTADLNNFKFTKEAFLIISSAEIYANLSRYDGVSYGVRGEGKNLEDAYFNTRSQGFGLNAKLQLILGSMVLSQNYYAPLYDKALRLRRIISSKLSETLKDIDVLLIPFNASENYDYNDLSVTALSALSGLPALNFTSKGQSYIAIANKFNENSLLAYAKEVCNE